MLAAEGIAHRVANERRPLVRRARPRRPRARADGARARPRARTRPSPQPPPSRLPRSRRRLRSGSRSRWSGSSRGPGPWDSERRLVRARRLRRAPDRAGRAVAHGHRAHAALRSWRTCWATHSRVRCSARCSCAATARASARCSCSARARSATGSPPSGTARTTRRSARRRRCSARSARSRRPRLVRRQRLRRRLGQVWLPLAGGVGLLAMLGTGKRQRPHRAPDRSRSRAPRSARSRRWLAPRAARSRRRSSPAARFAVAVAARPGPLALRGLSSGLSSRRAPSPSRPARARGGSRAPRCCRAPRARVPCGRACPITIRSAFARSAVSRIAGSGRAAERTVSTWIPASEAFSSASFWRARLGERLLDAGRGERRRSRSRAKRRSYACTQHELAAGARDQRARPGERRVRVGREVGRHQHAAIARGRG